MFRQHPRMPGGFGGFGGGMGGMRNMNNRRNRRGGGYAAILAMQLLNSIMQLPYKPPVTLAFIALNAAVHVFPDIIADLFPLSATFLYKSLSSVCMNPAAIVKDFSYGSWSTARLFGSAILHADDMHLMYNMMSLLNKGVTLETSIGSSNFLIMMVGLWVLSQALVVALSYILLLANYSAPYYMCSVGFSGVLFALKYILGHRSLPGLTQVMFWNVDIKYAAWAELFVIQLVVPNASFMGHLCGILAGVIWEHAPTLVLPITSKLQSLINTDSNFNRRGSYTYARGVSSQRASAPPRQTDTTTTTDDSSGMYDNNADSAEETAVQEAIRRSLLQDTTRQHSVTATAPTAAATTLSDDEWVDVHTNNTGNSSSASGSSSSLRPSNAEELRQRHLRRFDR